VGDTFHSSASGRSYWRWILPLLGFFCLSLLNWGSGLFGYRGPMLRFDIPVLNKLFSLFVLSVPWIVFVLLVKTRAFRSQTPVVLLLIPVLILTLPLAFLDVGFSSDEPVKTIDLNGYRVGLHLLNCGAPCSFMIAVDQERVLIPHVILSERLYIFDPAFDARAEVLGKNVLQVTTLPYNDEHPDQQTQVFRMKPHFFF
jgi:hypothetical protein